MDDALGLYDAILLQPLGVGRAERELRVESNPAAGAAYTLTLDGSSVRRLTSFVCRLVTDANAANRVLAITFERADGKVYARASGPLVQTASKTVDYAGFCGGVGGYGVTDIAQTFATPPNFLRPTDVLRVTALNIQATDQLSLIAVDLEEFPTDGVIQP